jgi:transcriptional antiterminator Rof (Rho-off)
MSDYVPIACGRYDIFEIACLRRQSLRVRWAADAPVWLASIGAGEPVLEPLGLETRDGAEWLMVCDGEGGALPLRLDWIAEARLAP